MATFEQKPTWIVPTLAMLVIDSRFAVEIEKLTDDQTFQAGRDFYNVGKIAREFTRKYKAPIGITTLKQEAIPINPKTGTCTSMSPPEQELILGIIADLERIYELDIKDGVEAFYRDEAKAWIESRRLENIGLKLMEVIEAGGDLEEIRKLSRQAATVPPKEGDDPRYYSILDPAWFVEVLAEDLDEDKPRNEIFSSGYGCLDDLGIYPRRGEVYIFVAGTSFGKTSHAVGIAKFCAERRIPAMIVTFEGKEKSFIRRVWQSMFALIDKNYARELTEPILPMPRFVDEASLETVVQDETLSWLQSHIARSRIRNWFKPEPIVLPSGTVFSYGYASEMLIKEFGPKSITLASISDLIEEVINDLPASQRPRVLILDHVSDVAPSGDKNTPHWAMKGNDIRELRALAIKHDLAVYTASQTNLQGYDAEEVKGKHIAESHQILQACDMAVTYSKTEIERRKGEGRASVEKGRNVQAGMMVKILQSIKSCQWCLDSRIIPPVAIAEKDWRDTAMEEVLENGSTIQHVADSVGKSRDTVRQHLKQALAASPGKYAEILKREDKNESSRKSNQEAAS